MNIKRLLRALLPAFMAPAIPYGGQACIEGVMMKGLRHAALAMRRSSGRIEIIDREVISRFPALTRLPFIRGFFILWDMMTLGTWALKESNRRFEEDMYDAEEDGEAKKEKARKQAESKGGLILEAVMLMVGFGVAIFMFKVLPAIAASYTFEWFGWGSLREMADPGLWHQLIANLVEGLVKLGIFVAYISLVGRMKEIRRVFEYHGAEHIVINAYEDDQDNQKMEFIQSHSVAHPRCGTSFIVILILVGVVLYTLLDYLFVANGASINAALPQWWVASERLGPAVHENIPAWWIRWPMRILAIPILAGISYEFIRAAFRYYENPVLRPLLRFGMLFQALTTRRPADDQVEVSLASFNRVRYLTEDIPEPEVPQPASSAGS